VPPFSSLRRHFMASTDTEERFSAMLFGLCVTKALGVLPFVAEDRNPDERLHLFSFRKFLPFHDTHCRADAFLISGAVR